MFPERFKLSPAESAQAKTAHGILLAGGLSLDRPYDLNTSLKQIQNILRDSSGRLTKYETLPGIAYFLGENMAAWQWLYSVKRSAFSLSPALRL